MNRLSSRFLLAFTFVAFSSVIGTEYDVSISYVNVWIKAFDGSGKQVTDLSPKDIVVEEDGKQMNVECFEKTDYVAPSDPFEEFNESQAAEVNGNKKFAIFADLFNTTTAEMRSLQSELQTFLLSRIDSNTEVMLAGLLPNRRLGVISGFTKNHEHLVDTLAKAPGNQTRDTEEVRNEEYIVNQIRTMEQGFKQFSTAGDMLRQSASLIKILTREEKEKALFTLKAIRAFGDYLATNDLGEHTVVVYISGGFSVEPGQRYYVLVEEALKRFMASQKEDYTGPLLFTQEPDFDIVNEIRNTAWYLNRLNITLYSIDTRGAVAGMHPVQRTEFVDVTGGQDFVATHTHQDSLVHLASNTGGVAFTGSQDYAAAFNSLLNDLHDQYLVCYRAPNHKKKGEYHKIKVVSKRPGVKLRYRTGYVS